MKQLKNPAPSSWQKLVLRPEHGRNAVEETVNQIFSDIKHFGDRAIHKYNQQFDHIDPENLKVPANVLKNASRKLSAELKQSILLAKRNIEKFHQSQVEDIKPVETAPGVICWRESRAIERIGIYIPGGSAPLFSTVLMLGIPAVIAGCKEIALFSPPAKNGYPDCAILYCAHLLGIKEVYAIGGVQAIGAMTFGTATIPKVYKIFGPGNQFVTAAKQMAQNYAVAIDLPAGPSEVLIIADETGNPEFLASDLLAQAEHGADSQVVLLSNSANIVSRTLDEVKKQMKALPRKDIAEKAMKKSLAILFDDLDTCVEFSNQYAPEHLILAVENYHALTNKITNAGSVFLGNYSCESAGDYASGTNHTLPTNGHAKYFSGLSLDSYVKKITFQELSAEGIKSIGPAVEHMAEAEKLWAHKNAVSLRLQQLASDSN